VPGAVCYPEAVESLGQLKIYLSRREIGGWDCWTLIPVVLAAAALIAAFGWYFWSLYRRSRSPAGVDWDAELGVDRARISPANPRDRFWLRLRFAGISVLTIFMGTGALITGHFSSSKYGRRYSADGTSARVAGGLLCTTGLLLGLVALFQDSELLNRPLGGREREP
jgi:hypothetical protein